MKRSPLKRGAPLKSSTYRTLRSDEPDPLGEPLIYDTSDGRRMKRWKVAPYEYVERVVRDENGRAVRSRPYKVVRVDREEAARRYNAGETLPQIAEALRSDSGNLSRVLRSMGVTMRTSTQYALPFDINEAVERFKAGEGATRIAGDLGVSVARIHRALKAAGLSPRGAGRLRGRGKDGGPVKFSSEFDSMKPAVRLRSGGACEASVTDKCSGVGTHVHHRKMRSQRGTNALENLLHVCLWCHSTIHRNPTMSYERGLLVRSTEDPALVPIQRRNG